MKKAILFLLLAAMLAPSFTACGGGENTTASTETTAVTGSAETVGAETELTDSLPAGLSFNGRKVAFYSNTYNALYSPNFVTEETGEMLNDARYNAELTVEEKLNVSIEEILGDQAVIAFDNAAKALILSGDTAYDLITNMDRFMIADVAEGMFYATSDLPYVNLDAVYWNPVATANFSVANKIWFTVSAFNLYSYKNTNCLYMNKDLADAMGITGIYDTVFDGKWTYDYFLNTISNGYSDINGDGTADEKDRYGFTSDTHSKNVWLAFLVGDGCATEVLHKDKNDFFEYGVSNKMYDVMDDINKLYNENKDTYITEDNTGKIKFEQGQSLFAQATVYDLEVTYREIEFMFSVLPFPKYDEDQEYYYNRTFDSFFTMAPVTNTELNPAGAVLEALSCEAYKNVMPVYIDGTLKNKHARDEQSAQMLQLILDSRTVNIAEAFMFNLYGNYGSLYLNYIKSNSGTLASVLETLRSATDAEIEKFNTFFKENAK